MVNKSNPSLLEGDIVVNGKRRVLARNFGRGTIHHWPGLAWRRVGYKSDQEPEADEPALVTEKWQGGWTDGMGEGYRVSRRSMGYSHGEDIDTTSFGFMRNAELNYSVTPVTVPVDQPTWFFEASDGTTTFIYCVQGRTSYKMSVSGTVITLQETKDFGAGAVVGRPDSFSGKMYVALGSTVVFVKLATVATPPATDTWTNADAGTYSLGFTAIMDGSTPKMMRAGTANTVSLASAEPLTSGNWGSAFSIESSSQTITSLVETGAGSYVATQTNLFKFTTEGSAIPIFNLPNYGDATNGSGLIAVPSTDTVLYNHSSGLHLVVGYLQYLNRGPDGIPTIMAIPNLTLEPYKGRHYESFIMGNWIYSTYRITSPSNRTYVLAGRMVGGPQNIIWHTINKWSSAGRGCYIDSSKRGWIVANDKINFAQRGVDGGPDPGTASNAKDAGTFYLPVTDFGYPRTLKQGIRVRVYGRNLTSTSNIQIKVLRDGGAAENVGATVTTDGGVSRFWTAGSNDTFWLAQFAIAYGSGGGDPQCWGLEIDALLRPDKIGVYEFILDCSAPFSNGEEQFDEPELIRSTTVALVSGASVTVIDPEGTSLTLNIMDCSDLIAMENSEGGTDYFLRVSARTRATS